MNTPRIVPKGMKRHSMQAIFSVDIKMRGEKARLDFDLSPSAEKKIRNYVWVSGRTGSNLAGRWVEREGR